jgi:hypothetical protein
MLEYNRGNDLVAGFLTTRYPNIVDEAYVRSLLKQRTYVVAEPVCRWLVASRCRPPVCILGMP